jgi:glucose-1-phosphate thymidylyltransferase
MLAGIREILIITALLDQKAFINLLGDGQSLGLSISYATQPSPGGIAQAFIIAERFINNNPVSLVLGDNIFYGHGMVQLLKYATTRYQGATVFAYYVRNPETYGVITFDPNNMALDLEEKPSKPKSNYVVTGLYFYDNNVVDIARGIKPSDRGELEITDVNKVYLQRGQLNVQVMGRGYAWLDTGTHDSLLSAANFIQVIEERQGLKIACIEEIAYRMGYIDADQLYKLAEPLIKSGYGQYLLEILKKEI